MKMAARGSVVVRAPVVHKHGPFTSTSVSAVVKAQNCKISREARTCLADHVPSIIDVVPVDSRLFEDPRVAQIQCSKTWFQTQLGARNISRANQDTVRLNTQTVLSQVLYTACQMVTFQQKHIVTPEVIESYIGSCLFGLRRHDSG